MIARHTGLPQLPKICVVFLLALSLFLLPNPSGNVYSEYNITPSFRIAQLSDIPDNQSITMVLKGHPLGNSINATIVFGFRFDSINDVYTIGFSQQYLRISSSHVFLRALGLGYDEMREYPFAYTTEGIITDFWKNHTPNWTSRRPYLTWTEESRWGGYLGPISEDNMTHLSMAGDIVEFENLTIYYEDGTSSLCGPELITIGVNFTRTDSEWVVQYLISSSTLEGVTIEESQVTIQMIRADRVSIEFISVLSGGIVLVIITITIYKKRKTIVGTKTPESSSIEPI
jgi:hypothetical protein